MIRKFLDIFRSGKDRNISEKIINYVRDNLYTHLIEEIFRHVDINNSELSIMCEGNSYIKIIDGQDKAEYDSGNAVSKESAFTIIRKLNDYIISTEFKFINNNTTIAMRIFDDGNGNYILIRITLSGSITNDIVMEKYINGSLDSVLGTDSTNTFKTGQRYKLSVKVSENNRITVKIGNTIRLDRVEKNYTWGTAGIHLNAVDVNSKVEIYKIDLFTRLQEVL